MTEDEDDGVLRRWHLRKTEARQGRLVEPEVETRGEGQAALSGPEEGEAASPDNDSSAIDVPDIETLDSESDFSVFLGEGVPEEIQRLALRKLWRLDPVLANLDGLVDYGEDFTDASTVVEGLRTAYRVGKGLLTDEEHAAKGEAASEFAASETGAAAGDLAKRVTEASAEEISESIPSTEDPVEPENERNLSPGTASSRGKASIDGLDSE